MYKQPHNLSQESIESSVASLWHTKGPFPNRFCLFFIYIKKLILAHYLSNDSPFDLHGINMWVKLSSMRKVLDRDWFWGSFETEAERARKWPMNCQMWKLDLTSTRKCNLEIPLIRLKQFSCAYSPVEFELVKIIRRVDVSKTVARFKNR